MKKLIVSIMFLATSLFAAIDLNTATVKELTSLYGIGKAKAEAIVKYRKTHSFKSVDDLKKVKGIGNKLFAKLKDKLTVKSSKNSNHLKKNFISKK